MLIDDVARLAARGQAIESVLFEHLGAWTAGTPEPGVAATLAAWASHHAWHAQLWAARAPSVPSLAVDPGWARDELDGLTAALGLADTTHARLAAAAAVAEAWEAELAAAWQDVDAMLDAPTARVLGLVLDDLRSDLGHARALLVAG